MDYQKTETAREARAFVLGRSQVSQLLLLAGMLMACAAQSKPHQFSLIPNFPLPPPLSLSLRNSRSLSLSLSLFPSLSLSRSCPLPPSFSCTVAMAVSALQLGFSACNSSNKLPGDRTFIRPITPFRQLICSSRLPSILPFLCRSFQFIYSFIHSFIFCLSVNSFLAIKVNCKAGELGGIPVTCSVLDLAKTGHE